MEKLQVTAINYKLRKLQPSQHEVNFAHGYFVSDSRYTTGSKISDGQAEGVASCIYDTHQAVFTRVMHVDDVQKPTIQTIHRLHLCPCQTHDLILRAQTEMSCLWSYFLKYLVFGHDPHTQRYIEIGYRSISHILYEHPHKKAQAHRPTP